MTRSGKNLSDEDRVLWSLVARSAVPLKSRKAANPEPLPPTPGTMPSMPVVSTAAVATPARKPLVANRALDRPTLDKLARGKLPIEGRVDLHGMTQSEAHSLLLSFLRRAQASDIRYVLIITGKGFSSGGDGVLRRQVPAWLSTPQFRSLVSSHEVSARHHGGEGALYVRLRKKA